MKTTLSFAMLFFAFFSNNSCGSTPVYLRPPIERNTEIQKVELLLDKTGSSSMEETQRFAENLREAIKDSENPWEIEIVGIGANGKGPWDAGTTMIKIDGGPIYEFDPEAVKDFYKTKCWGKKNCFDQKVKEAKKETDDAYEKARFEYDGRRREALTKLIDAIIALPITEPLCTDIQGMAERAAKSTETVILITDGDHNCKNKFAGLALNETIVVGLSPLNNEEPGEFMKRLREMSEKLDTENVKPTAMLDAAALKGFLEASGRKLLAQGGSK